MPVHSRSTIQSERRFSRNLEPENASRSPSVSYSTYHSDVELLEVTALDVRCLISANPEIGDKVSIDVQCDGGHFATISGLVHWKELRRSGYEIGMYMPSGLPPGMSGLVTELRRNGNRYRCRQSGLCFRQDTQSRSKATVVNYSCDGFAVQTELVCRIEDVVNFEWTCVHGRQQVSGLVLWQIEQLHGYLLGCQTQPAAGYRIAGLRV